MEKKSALPSTLTHIVNDIRQAIRVRMYYPALTVALTLPDICVGLTIEDSVFLKERHYVDFINKYAVVLGVSTIGMSGLDCYRLRGGMIHRGNAASHPYADWTRVVFTTPDTSPSIHGLSIVHEGLPGESVAVLDLERFCNAMIQAVEMWYLAHQNNDLVKAKVGKLLSIRPYGMLPFIGGGPVVASG